MSTPLYPLAPVAPLNIESSVSSPAMLRVAVTGEIDLANAAALRERLLRVLYQHRPDLLDVNLAGVTFMDCTGVAVLVGVRNAAIQAGCRMHITDPQPIVSRVLQLTGLLRVFTDPVELQRGAAGSAYPPGGRTCP
jgi:anti-anti-sigma factor